MPIDCSCPHCDRHFSVKDELAGRKTYCPGCKKLFRIPELADGPPTEHLAPLTAEDAAGIVAVEDATAEESLLVECPLCMGRMPFVQKQQGQVIVCSHCNKQIRVPTM
jgi:uncharacterized protein YbaR (Trm112 family)